MYSEEKPIMKKAITDPNPETKPLITEKMGLVNYHLVL